jgi:hypothetical protein
VFLKLVNTQPIAPTQTLPVDNYLKIVINLLCRE